MTNVLPQVHYDEWGRFADDRGPVPGYKDRAEGIYIGRSTDDGHTWSWQEGTIDSDPHPGPFTAEKIVELDTGRLLMACYIPVADQSRSISILCASEDAGLSWRYLSTIADVPDVSLNEPALLQTGSGRVISILWCNRGHEFYQAHSDDRGETWSSAVPSGIPGLGNPASLAQFATRGRNHSLGPRMPHRSGGYVRCRQLG